MKKETIFWLLKDLERYLNDFSQKSEIYFQRHLEQFELSLFQIGKGDTNGSPYQIELRQYQERLKKTKKLVHPTVCISFKIYASSLTGFISYGIDLLENEFCEKLNNALIKWGAQNSLYIHPITRNEIEGEAPTRERIGKTPTFVITIERQFELVGRSENN